MAVSSAREATPSLIKTLRRWKSTVRGRRTAGRRHPGWTGLAGPARLPGAPARSTRRRRRPRGGGRFPRRHAVPGRPVPPTGARQVLRTVPAQCAGASRASTRRPARRRYSPKAKFGVGPVGQPPGVGVGSDRLRKYSAASPSASRARPCSTTAIADGVPVPSANCSMSPSPGTNHIEAPAADGGVERGRARPCGAAPVRVICWRWCSAIAGCAAARKSAGPVRQIGDECVGDADRVFVPDGGDPLQVLFRGRCHPGAPRPGRVRPVGSAVEPGWPVLAASGSASAAAARPATRRRWRSGSEKPRVRACSTMCQRTGGAAGDQLLLVQPQAALVIVDEECGDGQVGLQHVVVDRVGIGEGECAAEATERRPPSSGRRWRRNPCSRAQVARTRGGASAAGSATSVAGSNRRGDRAPNAASDAASIAS